eukprot:CAMPEP_0182948688 /NCGR_PEP_ID=MMETSP0105_2-20130417/59884_1 /TAXON_ID=81532 ORGANISM="Acanthoeca-like sp., Strain 10tr" /NCGR_SAMPLE_ID=MMETSP0105_2 /ASSEMBLY_ACC=CAM_ASM_000205 /LENGTH=266 /DNA_ID=CAMNT_0025088981 /DNA_START=23 /DNA_END=823 /DNA_ORIENTATION=+
MKVAAWKLVVLALLLPTALSFVGTARADDGAVDDAEEDMGDAGVEDEVDVEAMDEDEDAEEEDEEMMMDMDEDEDEDLDASQDVEAVAYFIGNERNEFPAGSFATALISFDNQGTGPFEVKTIEGSFRYPQDFRYFLQNFTINSVNVTVPPGEQTTFVYKFKPSDQFDPRDIGLVININYIDEVDSNFRDAVFNDTVFITDPVEPVDYIGMLVYTVGSIFACYYTYNYAFSRDGTTTRTTTTKTETGTEGDVSEFLVEEIGNKKKK